MTMNVLTTQTLVTMMHFVRTQREPITAPVIMAMKEMVITALVRTIVSNEKMSVFLFGYREFSL